LGATFVPVRGAVGLAPMVSPSSVRECSSSPSSLFPLPVISLPAPRYLSSRFPFLQFPTIMKTTSLLLGATLAVGISATSLQGRSWSGTNLGQCQGTAQQLSPHAVGAPPLVAAAAARRSSYHLMLSAH
jgi:hypothetical protein